jgi:hypothetical protein
MPTTTPAIEREVTARWKIIAGVVIALCGTGGASTFFYYRGASRGEQVVTASDLDVFKNAIVSEMKVELKKTDERISKAESLGDRVLSLEKESQFNRTMLLPAEPVAHVSKATKKAPTIDRPSLEQGQGMSWTRDATTGILTHAGTVREVWRATQALFTKTQISVGFTTTAHNIKVAVRLSGDTRTRFTCGIEGANIVIQRWTLGVLVTTHATAAHTIAAGTPGVLRVRLQGDTIECSVVPNHVHGNDFAHDDRLRAPVGR